MAFLPQARGSSLRRGIAVAATALLIGGCSGSNDELAEGLEFLNEGWAQTPMADDLCTTFPEDRSAGSTDECLAFAQYLDQQGCPIGAFLFGFTTLAGEGQNPIGTGLDAGWAEVGIRYGCDIRLADFLPS